MNERNFQGSSKGGNNGILFLLAGGVILLTVAGFVYFRRNNDSSKSASKPPVVEAPAMQLTPLVIADKAKPRVLMSEDSGVEDDLLLKDDENKLGRKKRRSTRPEKMGKIDGKVVNKFINARFGQVRNCYERRLKKNAMLEGSLDLNINVSSKGKVTSIGVNKNTVGDDLMLQCVKKVIRHWEFPKPDGGRVVIGKSFKFKKKV